MKLQCGAVSHTVKSFIHTFFYAGVCPKESMVWFKVSGLCFPNNPGHSVELFLDIQSLSCVMGIL